MNRDQIIEYLSDRMNDKRLRHSQNVEQVSKELALRFGEDVQLAGLAGLVHDCAKPLPREQMRRLAASTDADAFEMDHAPLLHAPVGTLIARRDLGITDVRVLNAIRKHTVGSKHMSRLEKIIYLADIIEPLRTFEGVDMIRDVAQTNLDRALLLSFQYGMRYVLEHSQPLHPATLDAYNSLIESKRRDLDEQHAGTSAYAVQAVG